MIKYAPATEGAWHQNPQFWGIPKHTTIWYDIEQLIWKVTTVGEGNFLRFHHAR